MSTDNTTFSAADDLLDYDRAAALLDASPNTVRKLVAGRLIRYVKVGRLTKIPRSAVLEFIEANTVAAKVSA